MRARLVVGWIVCATLIGCAAILGIGAVPDAAPNADAGGHSPMDASDAAETPARDGGFFALLDGGIVEVADGGECPLKVPATIPCGDGSCDPSSRLACCLPERKAPFCVDLGDGTTSCLNDDFVECGGAADCPGAACCLSFLLPKLSPLSCSFEVADGGQVLIGCAQTLGLDAGCGGSRIACRNTSECPAGQTCQGFRITTLSGTRELGTCAL